MKKLVRVLHYASAFVLMYACIYTNVVLIITSLLVFASCCMYRNYGGR